MTARAVARRGEIFPGVVLPDIDGSAVFLGRFRGQCNLVVVCAGQRMEERPVTLLLEELAARMDALTAEAAQVLVVVTSPPAAAPARGRLAFPVLVDDGAHLHLGMGAIDAAGRPAPAVFVTDRFREIFTAYLPGRGHGLPGAKEILEWLVFINIQCPECGVPEWAP